MELLWFYKDVLHHNNEKIGQQNNYENYYVDLGETFDDEEGLLI